ncbi:MAG TPA: hypothetical protein VK543_14890 [Puia sp.]|nr:hypothetical protein [Puia sp.]
MQGINLVSYFLIVETSDFPNGRKGLDSGSNLVIKTTDASCGEYVDVQLYTYTLFGKGIMGDE